MRASVSSRDGTDVIVYRGDIAFIGSCDLVAQATRKKHTKESNNDIFIGI
jgi:hypothetical protein